MLDRWKSLGQILGLIMFWVWNIIAVLVVLFLCLPYLIAPIISAAFSGEIPLSIALCSLVLMAVPLLALVVGALRPKQVGVFFYGFEMPIIVLTLLRVFLVRELTFASAFLIGTGLIAVTVFGWNLWKNPDQKNVNKQNPGRGAAYVQTILMSLVLIAGIFVTVLSALYALPVTVQFLKDFFSFNWLGDMLIEPLLALILILFGTSMIALAAFPFYIGYYYPKMWKSTGQRVSSVLPKKVYWSISAFFIALWVAVHGISAVQSNADYVVTLKNMPVAEQAAQMQNPQKVRKHLLSAYLNEYRYIGRAGDETNLSALYGEAFGGKYMNANNSNNWRVRRNGIKTNGAGEAAQFVQNYLLSPLLYKGRRDDGAAAGKLYSELFDISIQRAERRAISKALEATYNRDEVTAGLMNIGARNVLLLEQNINLEDKGDYAVIEIEAAYENLTFDPQEIFYYFSLPEDAAITGLWIGRTPERSEMDAFIVAPRGAAQKVYEDQVRRRVDPALLEQVGPRQYRLRVFPIPVTKRRAGSPNRNRRTTKHILNPMRMHMRYVVPLGPDGFALPELLEKRNVNWSHKTRHMINGEAVKVKNSWMPTLPNAKNTFGDDWLFQTAFGGLQVEPIKTPKPKSNAGKSFAVLVDTSYSMNSQISLLQIRLQDLQEWRSDGGVLLDYYVTRKDGSIDPISNSFSAQDLKGFGTITPQIMLQDFKDRKAGKQYDGVIILTDQGRYAVKSDDAHKDPMKLAAPLWFLHLGQAAFAYDDNILDLIYRSGGGVADDVSDLRTRIYYAEKDEYANSSRVWSTDPKLEQIDIIPNDKNVGSLAAHQYVLQEAYGTPPTAENLDALHDMAKRYEIITPYSSMIVLVNERQKEALKKASEADDRFEREGRAGEETLTSPSNVMVSGVPEPHEWLLILLSLLMLTVLWRKREVWR